MTAVDSVGFLVEPGQVLGFLGSNRAGQSAAMKMIVRFHGKRRYPGLGIPGSGVPSRIR